MITPEFNEESSPNSGSFKSRAILGVPTIPAMVRWLVKTGIVKEEKTAGQLLILTAIFSVVATAIILYYFFSAN